MIISKCEAFKVIKRHCSIGDGALFTHGLRLWSNPALKMFGVECPESATPTVESSTESEPKSKFFLWELEVVTDETEVGSS